jgi:hypothetical protein
MNAQVNCCEQALTLINPPAPLALSPLASHERAGPGPHGSKYYYLVTRPVSKRSTSYPLIALTGEGKEMISETL